jgi:hypothetical protein
MSGANKSLNVLLVEDSPDDRFFFQHAFERAQTTARLFVANDGFDALDYLDNKGAFANAESSPVQTSSFSTSRCRAAMASMFSAGWSPVPCCKAFTSSSSADHTNPRTWNNAAGSAPGTTS